MSSSAHLVLVVFFFVCELLAAFNVPTPPRLNLGWLGLAFFAANLLPL